MLPVLVTVAAAQQGPALEWAPVAEVRGRTFGIADGEDIRAIEQVARVGLEVSRGTVSARVSFQEVRRWSAVDGTFSVEGSFAPEIAEGWARVDGQLSPNLGARLTIGRQPVVIDDGRLVGRQRWDLAEQFLDAVRLEITAVPLSFEYVNARRFVPAGGDPFGTEAAVVGDDPLGFGVNVVRIGAGREGAVSRWLVDGVSVVDARDTELTIATVGVFTRLDAGRWRSRGEAYVQGNPQGGATSVALEAGWVLGPDELWRVSGGVDVASGDSPTSEDDAAFRPVLGDTHDLHGLLDLFVDPEATDDEGLVDLSVGAEARPVRPLRIAASARRLSSAVNGVNFGVETDVQVTWQFSPFGLLDAGYGHFFPLAGYRDRGVDGGYIELDVSF